MEEEYLEEGVEELPRGVELEGDLIDKLITPEYKGVEGKNPLVSRDTILGNFTEEEINVLKLFNEIYELGSLSSNNYVSWRQWLNSVGRRMKLITLLTRGKQGFQNQLLKTNIVIHRRGLENRMPEEY